MAYVQPNSIIQLFQGINLDNRYLHTIYFSGASAQDSWFSSKASWTFQAQSYVRYTRNQIKLQCDVTEILGATYMRFKNDTSVDMWFYAFINLVEYINENTALITYEIDVMQTWFIQRGNIRPCMVLREHVSDDTFGINLEAEPTGSDVYDSDFIQSFDDIFKDTSGKYDLSIVINSTGNIDSSTALKGGLFVGTKHTAIRCNTVEDCRNVYSYLNDLLGNWNAGEQKQEIIDMYTVPTSIARQGVGQWINFACNMQRPTAYDNYVPKNNKLFMYPYSYLLCTTHNGESAIYRWEYFDGVSVEFRALGTHIGGGQIIAYPLAYNGQPDNLDCGLVITDFPKNSYSYDAYQAWIANGGKTRLENDEQIVRVKGASSIVKAAGNIFSNTLDMPESIMTAGAGALQTYGGDYARGITNMASGLGGVVGGILNTATSIADTYGNIKEAMNKISYRWKDSIYTPDVAVGKSVPALAVGSGNLNYYFYHCHVRDDEAKRIDDFFSMFGYSINRVKFPNFNSRAYWNFIQTENCVIGGNMPASSKEAIGRIFDGGITFWHNGDQIGNYNQSVSDGSINNPIV